jgi:hypothetical protein
VIAAARELYACSYAKEITCLYLQCFVVRSGMCLAKSVPGIGDIHHQNAIHEIKIEMGE